jgi:hypothetical protein
MVSACCYEQALTPCVCLPSCLQNVLYQPAGGSFFIYFTNWTFVLFGLTAVLGAALTTKVGITHAQAASTAESNKLNTLPLFQTLCGKCVCSGWMSAQPM